MRMGLLNPQGHVWNLKDSRVKIGSHPDTGGQITYIIKLSEELGKLGVKVDIFTKRIIDEKWKGFESPVEEINENAKIIRLDFGKKEFIPKEQLWPYMKDFADCIVEYYKENELKPDIFTGHYADGGLTGCILNDRIKSPFTHTGHSLGGDKMDGLGMDKKNDDFFNKMVEKYQFEKRIFAERLSFNRSYAIVHSTQEERKKQYGHRVYHGAIQTDDPKFSFIPPGISENQFYYYDTNIRSQQVLSQRKKALDKLSSDMSKTITEDRMKLPIILSASRFDRKKNIIGIIKSFASHPDLPSIANLVILAGKVEDPLNNLDKFEKQDEINIVKEVKDLIAKNNLKDKVSILANYDFHSEIPWLYKYVAETRGIFTNMAIHEPFGLTIVEAMASGLPVVATDNGGPVEILDNGRYGILVNPNDYMNIGEAFYKLLKNKEMWDEYSIQGNQRAMNNFTWKSAAEKYLHVFEQVLKGEKKPQKPLLEIPKYYYNPEEENAAHLKTELRKLYFNENS